MKHPMRSAARGLLLIVLACGVLAPACARTDAAELVVTYYYLPG